MAFFWNDRPSSGKHPRNYRTSNRFSEHDNRNSFQDHGVYFGDGNKGRQLGRSLLHPQDRLHHSNPAYLKHNGREIIEYDYHTTYQKSFLGKDTETPPKYRRFPKSLPQVQPAGRIPLDTTTTEWQPSSKEEHRTNTQVLAVSQEPFLKHNPWQYSYHSKRNVYPPYERRTDPVIDNIFNRYGAAYNSSASMNSSGFNRSLGLSSMESVRSVKVEY